MTQVKVNITEAPNSQHALIRFNGHINARGRGDGLPATIFAFVIVENANSKFISDMIESQSGAFIRSQAMYVQRDQGAIIDIRDIPDQRMLVPFHNIAYIDVDVMPLVGELSLPDEEGVERLSNGAEPTKH